MKLYILYGIVACALFFTGCSKDEDNDVHGTENITDWFEVKDKPGELNQALYRIYKDYGLTIFVNDTLGQEERGVDAYGEPIIYTELFDPGYYVFGTYTDFDSIRLSVNEEDMLKALEVIEERVIPYLPKSGQYRPHSLLLVQAVYMHANVPKGWFGERPLPFTHPVYFRSLKGVMCGDLSSLQNMDDEELSMWAGRIITSKTLEMYTEKYQTEVDEFYAITDEDKKSGTYYDQNCASSSTEAQNPCENLGFLKWRCEDNEYKVTLSKTEDLHEFISAVYAYRGKESAFTAKYGECSKILRKFEIMKKLVEKFEESLN